MLFKFFFPLLLRKNSFTHQFLGCFIAAVVVFVIHDGAIAQQYSIPQHVNKPIRKVSPLIKMERGGANVDTVVVSVSQYNHFSHWMDSTLFGVKHQKVYENIYRIDGVTPIQVQMLIDCPWVVYVDKHYGVGVPERILDNMNLSANKISSLHSLYPSIRGKGLVLAVKDDLFDTTDIDYCNRIGHREPFNLGLSFHSTIVSTIAIGAGNSSPKGLGVAPEASVCFLGRSTPTPDSPMLMKAAGVSVQNHSYGHSNDNSYGSYAYAYDSVAYKTPTVMHVFSSGNEGWLACASGDYKGIVGFGNITGQYKMAKNIITVGEVNNHDSVKVTSSRGPAYDGRVKPELVAFGDMGTSESAPVVAGICLLVQDAYRQKHGMLPTIDAIKATLFNSADDVGRPQVDFENGYGNVDALGAVTTVLEDRLYSGELYNEGEQVIPIVVPNGSTQLKVTLAWIDPPAPRGVSAALVNDLDLSIRHVESGREWLPWVLCSKPIRDSLLLPAKRRVDRINNAEQVTVELPDAGEYQIVVRANRVVEGKQAFSIAYEYEKGFAWHFPLRNSKLASNQMARIRWSGIRDVTNGTLDYQDFSTGKWTAISDKVNPSLPYFDWTVPQGNMLTRLRLMANGKEYLSDTFAISTPIVMYPSLNCSFDALLTWDRIPGLATYRVYSVVNGFLTQIRETTDTSVSLSDAERVNSYYAVCPVVEGVEGVMGNTTNYRNAGCYVKSFYPDCYVTDTVNLKLLLSSTYLLESATLERSNGSGFIAVESFLPEANSEFSITDGSPFLQYNQYRILFKRSDSRTFYSEVIGVIYVHEGDFMLFPNPVAIGQDCSIVDGEDGAVEISIYDIFGRLVDSQITISGGTKSISTSKLNCGQYMVSIRTEKNHRKVLRLVVN